METAGNSASSEAANLGSGISNAEQQIGDNVIAVKDTEATSPNTIQATLTWFTSWAAWSSTATTKGAQAEAVDIVCESTFPVEPEKTAELTATNLVSPIPISKTELTVAFDWFTKLFAKADVLPEAKLTEPVRETQKLTSNAADSRELVTVVRNKVTQPILTQVTAAGSVAMDTVQAGVANAMIAGIRLVSSERDRDEIIRWFMNAREILARGGSSIETATALYQSTDTVRFAKLLANTVATSLYNYYGANLPLALKVAVPVTLIGAGYFGMQGAGVLAFGTGIGLPVVLLLFLGTAGVTTIIEAFVKDRSIRDPLTKLLLMFVAFETARRAKKELLDAMRADAMVPERAQVPSDGNAVLDFLMKMDPVVFERHIMSYFEQDGHPTGLTARSNDFGVDGYVFHPDGVIVVQCKRYSADNSVGRPAIQQFKGVIEEQRAFKGYFVTTSRFTDEAKESAAKSNRIILIDGEELVRWHKEGRRLI